jgi:probable metal-binding protein
MHQSFHGHELIRLIAAAESPVPEEQLHDLARLHFGDSPSFHTCSRQNLSLDELLAFLFEKGKLRRDDDGVAVVRERICQDA